MTHPLSRCSQLLGDFSVCNIRFEEHAGEDHAFVTRQKWRGHIPNKVTLTYCGRSDVYVILEQEAPRYVKQALLSASVCQACLKNWFYFRERGRILGWS